MALIGPARTYDPRREDMFARMLARGQHAPVRSGWDALGSLAQIIGGTIGTIKQGRARERDAAMAGEQQANSLARVMAGLGVNVSPQDVGVLAQNPNIMGEVLQRSRPVPEVAPAEPKMVKAPDGFNYWATGPQAGQRVLPDVEKPPEPEKERRIVQGADGYQYYADTRERVLPGVEKPVEPKQRRIVVRDRVPYYEDTGQPVVPGAEGAADAPDIRREGELRKEYSGLSGDFVKVRDAIGRIEASSANPSAAGDLALIFNYMKMLDPNSVVRESEFATAANAGGVPERVRAQFNRLQRGERLSEGQRADFLGQSRALYDDALGKQRERDVRYGGLAEQYGFEPSRIVRTWDGQQDGGQQPGAGADQMVQMRAPDGTVQAVPAGMVEHYRSLGAALVR